VGRGVNYPPELRERAIRMVAEVRPDYPSDLPAICAVAAKLGDRRCPSLKREHVTILQRAYFNCYTC
jgi:hypothetical protein